MSTKPSTIEVLGTNYPTDDYTNITPAVLSRLNARLIDKPSHPLATLKSLIESHFSTYAHFSSFPPLVTPQQNFDDLSFAKDHPGRSVTDSYYINRGMMLRTHTSAHEVEIFKAGYKNWLLTADVYRRDEIDSSHYPIFHQVEGARLWRHSHSETAAPLAEENERLRSELSAENLRLEDKTFIDEDNPYQKYHDPELADLVTQNLKYTLSLMLFKLFAGVAGASKSNPLQIRWISAFFPFTSPSYEVEVLFRDKWLEILGCGVVQQATLTNASTFRSSHRPILQIYLLTTNPARRDRKRNRLGLRPRPRTHRHDSLPNPRHPSLLVLRSPLHKSIQAGRDNYL